ncbi:MAG: YHS domain-containing protein, partial [Candidatus Acidiferrales bacterium]
MPIERDPVCGMTVDPARAKHSFAHGGKTFFFCGAGCLEKFRAEPVRYGNASAFIGIGAAKSIPVEPATEIASPAPHFPASLREHSGRRQAPQPHAET